MARLQVGDSVNTEWGHGKVTEHSDRSVTVTLDDGGKINVVTGTPGYDRIVGSNPLNKDDQDAARERAAKHRDNLRGKPWTHKNPFGGK